MVLRYYTGSTSPSATGRLPALEGMDELEEFDPIAACEEIAAPMPNRPASEHGAPGAYHPARDVVSMPDRDRFESAEAYYGTLFHELGHPPATARGWTARASLRWAGFGTADYPARAGGRADRRLQRRRRHLPPLSTSPPPTSPAGSSG
jgi:hypothetical protein